MFLLRHHYYPRTLYLAFSCRMITSALFAAYTLRNRYRHPLYHQFVGYSRYYVNTFITNHILYFSVNTILLNRYIYHLTTLSKTRFLSNPPSISNGFQVICIFPYLGYDLDLSGSFYVITMNFVLLLFGISNTLFTYLLTYLLYQLLGKYTFPYS